MNPAIKEALKEDLKYTVSMYVYIVVIMFIFGSIGMLGSGPDGNDSHYFFYTYVAIFGVFITSAYCASKAKMDRYFSMGFSRNTFKKQAMLLGTLRSVILAVGFSLLSMLAGQNRMIGAVENGEWMSPAESLVINMTLLFLFGWTVNNHMLADAMMEKPRVAAAVYLTSPSIWSFNNNKQAKNRSGNRAVYLLMIIVYAGVAVTVSTIIQWFFQWWILVVVVIGLVILNLVLVRIFTRKIKQIDIV